MKATGIKMETKPLYHMHPVYGNWSCGETTGILTTDDRHVSCPECLKRMGKGEKNEVQGITALCQKLAESSPLGPEWKLESMADVIANEEIEYTELPEFLQERGIEDEDETFRLWGEMEKTLAKSFPLAFGDEDE